MVPSFFNLFLVSFDNWIVVKSSLANFYTDRIYSCYTHLSLSIATITLRHCNHYSIYNKVSKMLSLHKLEKRLEECTLQVGEKNKWLMLIQNASQ